ncbi:MAG TPA: choice-of-anchor Q domain-containing protein [Candidatus Acidoferrum sp.]|nr:choice-of-anchor Q domain-containing protein [Candidatus Acidoferrum sp.]
MKTPLLSSWLRLSFYPRLIHFQHGAMLWLFLGVILREEASGTVLTNCSDADLRTAMSGGGLITFACDGTISLTNEIAVTLDTLLDASGHQVLLSGRGVNRMFTVNAGRTLTLTHLVLQNGLATATNGTSAGPTGTGAGGAILNQGGTLSTADCWFQSNVAVGLDGAILGTATGGQGMGGAIATLGGVLVLTNTMFQANSAIGGHGRDIIYAGSTGGTGGSAYGGAISSDGGAVTADHCYFQTNSSVSGGPGVGQTPGAAGDVAGGAVFSTSGTLKLLSSMLSINSCPAGYAAGAAGGGAYVVGGVLEAANCLFATNSASGGSGDAGGQRGRGPGNGLGGGLWISAPSNNLSGCAFIANSASGGANSSLQFGLAAGVGGAVYNAQTLTMANCTLFGNVAQCAPAFTGWASGHGGAIYNQGGTGILTHVTVVGNAAQFGAITAPAAVESPAGPMTLQNSILAFSTVGSMTCSNGYGNLIDGGGSISSDTTPALTDPTSHNNVNPLLGPLGYQGGLTPTVPLLPGSPAIDAGISTTCLPSDQRGYPRPYGAGCDIGAFEFWPSNSVFGRISGYAASPGGMTVASGAISASVRADGIYGLAGLPAGVSAVVPRCADAVFVPGSRVVSVPPDIMGVDFYAYRSNALMIVAGSTNALQLRLAGQPGRTYSLLISTNLQTWFHCATNTTTSDGLTDFAQTNQPAWNERFFRAISL